MIVYLETNFVLELALMQEQHDSCDAILLLAEATKVRIFVPAFSLAEPFETLTRRNNERKQLAERLRNELNQLGRSKPYQSQIGLHQAVTRFLLQSGEEEAQRLNETRQRLLDIAEIIPLNQSVLLAANLAQAKHGLSPQDAIVFASVMHHIEHIDDTESCCFLNRNSKDFATPDIEDAFSHYRCKLLFDFRDGYQFIQSHLS